MQQSQHQNRPEFRRRVSRPVVDGIGPRRVQSQYVPRSRAMLPGNDEEYMISLGQQASRRQNYSESSWTGVQKGLHKIRKIFMTLSLPQLAKHQAVLAIVGISVLVIGIGVSLARSGSSVIANQDVQRVLLQDNGDTPTDSTPYNHAGFAVPASMPKSLTISKLGVAARIVRLGVRDNSEPKHPGNIHDVGWYENSSKPGEEGTALLIGHINGQDSKGVFHDLTNLVPGDEFSIEMGDGTVRYYYISKMEAYDRNNVDYNALLTPSIIGRPGVTLLTAAAAYESNADVQQQLAVFAVEKGDGI